VSASCAGNLSAYLGCVSAGERFEVTVRGVPVARLEPLVPVDDPLSRLEAEAKICIARRGRGNLADLPPPLKIELERPLTQILDELKEERL
jgi:antitoxin (DNA-binding transcriptional repressor) of toxin-antitoxin stability system